eukprot:6587333-Pyramimonas_sp.AAC.1
MVIYAHRPDEDEGPFHAHFHSSRGCSTPFSEGDGARSNSAAALTMGTLALAPAKPRCAAK